MISRGSLTPYVKITGPLQEAQRMSRILTLAALVALLTLPAVAATPCNLTMSMSCANGACTAVTTNSGGTMCTGEYIAAIFVNVAAGQATVSNFRLTPSFTNAECFDNNSLPLGLPFGACLGDASLGPGNSFTMTANVSPAAGAPSPLPIIGVTEVLDPATGDEVALVSAINGVVVTTCTPTASVPAVTLSGSRYSVAWPPVSDPNSTFTVEEST